MRAGVCQSGTRALSLLLELFFRFTKVLEITDPDGAAAEAGLQAGDVIFGLDGVDYGADHAGFDPSAMASPSDEEESQVSEATSVANEDDDGDSDEEDTSAYRVELEKCFPGMRLAANVNYGYGMVRCHVKTLVCEGCMQLFVYSRGVLLLCLCRMLFGSRSKSLMLTSLKRKFSFASLMSRTLPRWKRQSTWPK